MPDRVATAVEFGLRASSVAAVVRCLLVAEELWIGLATPNRVLSGQTLCYRHTMREPVKLSQNGWNGLFTSHCHSCGVNLQKFLTPAGGGRQQADAAPSGVPSLSRRKDASSGVYRSPRRQPRIAVGNLILTTVSSEKRLPGIECRHQGVATHPAPQPGDQPGVALLPHGLGREQPAMQHHGEGRLPPLGEGSGNTHRELGF